MRSIPQIQPLLPLGVHDELAGLDAGALFYRERGRYVVASAAQVRAAALKSLEAQFNPGESFNNPRDTREYLRLRFAHLPHEIFGVVYLDVHYCVIEVEELFRGTINQAIVYPREVAKAVLSHNASAVVLFHNHPTGNTEPLPLVIG